MGSRLKLLGLHNGRMENCSLRPALAFLLILPVAGCTASTPSSPAPVDTAVAQSREAPGRDLAFLDSEVEFAAYEARSVRQVFADLAQALFSGRLEVVGEADAEFQGEVSLRPLRDALDAVCQQSQCTWDVKGTPPTLILYQEGKQ